MHVGTGMVTFGTRVRTFMPVHAMHVNRVHQANNAFRSPFHVTRGPVTVGDLSRQPTLLSLSVCVECLFLRTPGPAPPLGGANQRAPKGRPTRAPPP